MSDETTTPTTAASAPGKVLLAGGYLVLDRDYTGLAFGLDARIHVVIRSIFPHSGVPLPEIVVRSPQFHDAEWRYGYTMLEEGGGIRVTQLENSSGNPSSRNIFIETALGYALSYITIIGPARMESASITILADEAYYSSANDSTAESREQEHQTFKDFGVSLVDAHKTGLGSSAALVVAFIAAMLTHYLPPKLLNIGHDDGRSQLHNLAQIAHCTAQGKIGSGFDVAAAVYGSCVYRRFTPVILEGLREIGSAGFVARLQALVELEEDRTSKWDHEVISNGVKVPRGIRLVMCDVDCGSQTVGMVKQVLAWRRAKPVEADKIWVDLQKSNLQLQLALVHLYDYQEHHPFACGKVYEKLAQAGDQSSRGTSLCNGLYDDVRKALQNSRRLVQAMSSASGVHIEPPQQTRLLDDCCALAGVIGGVVPGAGGYDAIALLVIDRPEVLKRLNGLLKTWRPEGGPCLADKSGPRVRPLEVREGMEGARVETSRNADYVPWLR